MDNSAKMLPGNEQFRQWQCRLECALAKKRVCAEWRVVADTGHTLCLPDPADRPGRKTHHTNLHFSLVQIIAVYIKNFPTVSSSVFIKGEKMGKSLWQGNNNKMYATQRWWEDIMVFYIFDIEPKLSHRKEVMNLHSLIITPS